VHSLPALLDTLLSQFILNTINTHSRINWHTVLSKSIYWTQNV
jgi:hypothetical protein